MAVEAEGEGSKKHIIVPMARLLNNQDVLSENVEPWLSSGEALQDLEIDLADAPEEPQVGFRWDSLVSYQSSMRYGRRSKLELLWRLGAIPFSRGLHIKRLPWEKQDHLYITPHSYASAVTSSVQQKQTTFGISDGDFAKAGWVHRLFSGDTSQEHSTTRAAELRRLNRMRGIVAYLETLDIKASLGSSNGSQITLGDRFWHWNQQTLSGIREEMNGLARDAHKVNNITRLASDLQHRLSNKLRWQAATNSGLHVDEITGSALSLALSGYLCKNPHFSDAALKGVMAILSTPTVPVYQTTLSLGQLTMGYAFPTLPHILSGTQHSISLPYNPFTFEIASLLDAVKLVRLSQPAFIPNVAQQKWLAQMEDVFKQHLRVLLLSDDSLALSKAPRTLELALKYDTAVAALSAHLNLPSLVTRVQTRHSLRYLDPETGEPSSSDISTHPPYETFTTGMKNVALEQSQALSRSRISHSILDELIISMQGQ